ncbi:MAG: hypothetical protein AAFP16_10200 [Pseudomonadota bacterium]
MPFPSARSRIWVMLLGCALLVWAAMAQAEPVRFVGTFAGSAEVLTNEGTRIPRDMSVTIEEADEGFLVKWTSVTYRPDGRTKEKSYSIRFVESERDRVYAAAQKRNIFGHMEPLNPMKGEPYAWARIDGDTLTVYSLFVDENGGYSLQQYDRTLAEGGMNLRFQVIVNGDIPRAVETFLTRVE